MWCAQCEAEVATELAADGTSLLCTSCGDEVGATQTPSLHPEIHRARKLIERLSQKAAEQKLSAAMERPSEAPAGDPSAEGDQRTEQAGPPDGEHPGAQPRHSMQQPVVSPQFRIDGAHDGERIGPARRGNAPSEHRETGGDRRDRRHDDAHAVLTAPHFDLSAMPQSRAPGTGESIGGQVLAYGGVAVLTVGTALVLWGHFGGPEQYAPTGWLVATAGQMLLFLGVVTLISGGMQQTTHQVTSRVEVIGNRLLRFEQTAEELLRGPHFGRTPETHKQTVAGRQGESAEDDPAV